MQGYSFAQTFQRLPIPLTVKLKSYHGFLGPTRSASYRHPALSSISYQFLPNYSCLLAILQVCRKVLALAFPLSETLFLCKALSLTSSSPYSNITLLMRPFGTVLLKIAILPITASISFPWFNFFIILPLNILLFFHILLLFINCLSPWKDKLYEGAPRIMWSSE